MKFWFIIRTKEKFVFSFFLILYIIFSWKIMILRLILTRPFNIILQYRTHKIWYVQPIIETILQFKCQTQTKNKITFISQVLELVPNSTILLSTAQSSCYSTEYITKTSLKHTTHHSRSALLPRSHTWWTDIFVNFNKS